MSDEHITFQNGMLFYHLSLCYVKRITSLYLSLINKKLQYTENKMFAPSPIIFRINDIREEQIETSHKTKRPDETIRNGTTTLILRYSFSAFRKGIP